MAHAEDQQSRVQNGQKKISGVSTTLPRFPWLVSSAGRRGRCVMANYQIAGWGEYDSFLHHLRRLGIDFLELRSEWCETGLVQPSEERDLRELGLAPVRLRKASFKHPITGSDVILEEYIRTKRYRDHRLFGVQVETVQYRAGERPNLWLWCEREET